MLEQLVLRHDLGDEARGERLLGAERLAEQQQLGGALVAGDHRQQEAGRGFGHHAKRHEGHLEARIGRGVDQVAVQEHGRADADRGAADRGNQRLLHLRQPADEVERRRGPGVRIAIEEILQVVAGREAILAAVDQDRAHLRVGVRGGERLRHGAVHVLRQRVLLVGARELYAQHAVFGFGKDVARVAHHVPSTTVRLRPSSWPGRAPGRRGAAAARRSRPCKSRRCPRTW
jgi:hypothetical protein